jgi:hypothetical protein
MNFPASNGEILSSIAAAASKYRKPTYYQLWLLEKEVWEVYCKSRGYSVWAGLANFTKKK